MHIEVLQHFFNKCHRLISDGKVQNLKPENIQVCRKSQYLDSEKGCNKVLIEDKNIIIFNFPAFRLLQ
jgi:hypothetical protein